MRHSLRLSLRTLPCVRDHRVYAQPDGWAEESDWFPVVPMTTMLELAADAARRHTGAGGATVTGYDDVRALRWLPVEPAVDVAVATRDDGPGRVRVTLGEYASVVVLLGGPYGAPPVPDRTALTAPGPAPVSAAALYRDRWMFHGPRFAGVHEVRTVAADGIGGRHTRAPRPRRAPRRGRAALRALDAAAAARRPAGLPGHRRPDPLPRAPRPPRTPWSRSPPASGRSATSPCAAIWSCATRPGGCGPGSTAGRTAASAPTSGSGR
ncbi:hypothetical protein GCM10020254_69980 [Streptomyces goshikiensis]